MALAAGALVGLGIGMAGMTVFGRDPSSGAGAVSGGDVSLEAGRIAGLEKELAAAREAVSSLEARNRELESQRAEVASAPIAPAAGATDLNEVFAQAKPLLQSLSPMIDAARRRGAQAMIARRLATLTEKYALTDAQQATVKKWLEDQSEQQAAQNKELLNKPGSTLQDLLASGGRGPRLDEKGLDEVMAATLSPEQLATYQADRGQERAANVEREATRRVTQLNEVVTLDEVQQDKVFALMARSSDDYDPAMKLEGLESDAVLEGSSRDEAIMEVLTPEQKVLFEADRQRRREAASKGLEAIGIKPPTDPTALDALGPVVALSAQPVAASLGLVFVAVAAGASDSPRSLVGAVGAAEVLRKAAAYVLSRPAREALFARLPPALLYESKLLLDALAPRAGDAAAALWSKALTSLAAALKKGGGVDDVVALSPRAAALAGLPLAAMAAVAAVAAGRVAFGGSYGDYGEDGDGYCDEEEEAGSGDDDGVP